MIPLQRKEADTLIHDFYAVIGQPKVTNSLLKHSRQQIAELLDVDWTLSDIAIAIAYIKNGEKDDKGRPVDERGKPIGSFGYVQHVIVKAVEEAQKQAEATARKRRQDEDEERRVAQKDAEAQAYLQSLPDKKITPSQPELAQPAPQLVPVDVPLTLSRAEYEYQRNAYMRQESAWFKGMIAFLGEGGTEEEYKRRYPPPEEPEHLKRWRDAKGRSDAVAVGDAIPGILTRVMSKMGVELGAA